MGPISRICGGIALFGAVFAVCALALADETSTRDKLRILYSNRFLFDDRGMPIVTIELHSGASEITLRSADGVAVRPDGDGGAELRAGNRWTVRGEDLAPATIREWTIVERLGPDDEAGVERATRAWRERGYRPRRFETGTVFGVDGEVIDSREFLVGVAPVDAPRGAARARSIASKHGVATSVHPEMVRRPQGTIVATSGDVTIRNPGMLWFYPAKRRGTLAVDDIEVGRGGSQLDTRRETRRYLGAIYVTVGRDGGLTVVNAVSADDLLAGLVPSEIYATAPRAALEAQAIAARTELLQKIGTRHTNDPYLLCSSQHCQVYSGAGHEHPRTTRAVRATRGAVLLRDGGGLVDARYSAACGGHGEHNETIWGGEADPSLRGHLDAKTARGRLRAFADGVGADEVEAFLDLPADSGHCGRTKWSEGRFRWEKRMPARVLDERVAAHYPRVGRVTAIEPRLRGVSGRIRKLRVVGTKDTIEVTGDVHIRRLLGGLRSTLFTVEVVGSASRPKAFLFRGAGFGHGVGMCQLGAVGLAETGKNHAEILQHYYAGARIRRLY